MSIRSAYNRVAKGPRAAGRTVWKKGLDLPLYLLFCALAGTGYLLAYRLPHGPSAGETLFLGFGRHMWGEAHTWLAWATIVIGAIHLSLNLQWLIKVAASKRPWRLVAGVLAGLLIVVLFLFFPTNSPAS
jgi:Domain of unknown function (DUF4405)